MGSSSTHHKKSSRRHRSASVSSSASSASSASSSSAVAVKGGVVAAAAGVEQQQHRHKRHKKEKKEKKHSSHHKKKEKRSHHHDHPQDEKDGHGKPPTTTTAGEEMIWTEKPSVVVVHRADVASGDVGGAASPSSLDTATTLPASTVALPPAAIERASWMLDAPENLFGGTTMVERKKKDPRHRQSNPDPNAAVPVVSARELNPNLRRQYGMEMPPPGHSGNGTTDEETTTTTTTTKPDRGYTYGDAGSNWRMMKLKRTMEQADREARPLHEVASERYGSYEDFEEARRERDELDRRRYGRGHSGGHGHGHGSGSHGSHGGGHGGGSHQQHDRSRTNTPPDRRDFRRPGEPASAATSRRGSEASGGGGGGASSLSSSSSWFRRPGDDSRRTSVSTGRSRGGDGHDDYRDPKREAFDKKREELLFQPLPVDYHAQQVEESEVPSATAAAAAAATAPLNTHELNKLQAKALRARLMDAATADALEQEYAREKQKADQRAGAGAAGTASSTPTTTVSLPMYNSRGEFHDVGDVESARARAASAATAGERGAKKSSKKRRDKDGGDQEAVAADDVVDLQTLVRQERMAGSTFDEEFARRVATDAQFDDNLDYMDDNVHRLSRKHEKSEEQKRKYAISDYKRSQELLDKCWYCCEENRTPRVSVVAVGVQVYLAVPKTLSLVAGHCLIVPMQHRVSTLECDDEEWDEIRNFMKCVMRMCHAQDKGVVFQETVTHFKRQRHCFIECIPVPYGPYEEAPGCFKQSILAEAEEWAQNRKLIDSSERGFRKSLVKNLPYFHVWFGLDKSYGHVIENEDSFPQTFGKEVIASLLELPRDRWRKPRHKTPAEEERDLTDFRKVYGPFDWTKQLAAGALAQAAAEQQS